jgi:energy-coupling factor transporter ATP-binding protein EcfA2
LANVAWASRSDPLTMPWKVLIAHAPGEEHWAEILAEPLREAGYEVLHSGIVLVGDSLVEGAAKVLSLGGPVVLCATIKAVGTRWARRLVNAARLHSGTRTFVVQMDEEANMDLIAPDEKSVAYWRNPEQAVQDLLAALRSSYPPAPIPPWPNPGVEAETRYRDRMLKACNLIDLVSLAGQDFSQAPELRQLYVPLRMKVKRLADQFSIGERLSEFRRLVVVGETGAGKSTLIRWLATAYLLRLRSVMDMRGLPDAGSLPSEDLLPVVISCRDLDAASAAGSLEEILRHTLRSVELSKEETGSLLVRLWERLQSGRVLLLFDGLDALTDLQVRVRFCRQLEKIALAYEQTPIVVTSRPAGYQELEFRLGGFEHAELAELSRRDKDLFAHLWSTLTEPRPDRRELKKEELIREIHATHQIERLTGSPMLLTIMALVKHKLGKLPQRRADLYGEAVHLLLNGRAGESIEPREALPQLEYLAYAMCDQGLQQVTETEALALLEPFRNERPRAAWLQGQTGILRRAGERWDLDLETSVPVYELPHPAFQEYLAARALVDGCFPGASSGQSLAERVGPLAGRTVLLPGGEVAVSEHWRETLRLCAACCGEAIEEVLLAILRPLPGEDASTTERSRVILASICLADEPGVSDQPGVSEKTSREILSGLARQVSNRDPLARTSLDAAILELAETHWAARLKLALTQEFQRREPAGRWSIGFIFSKLAGLQLIQRADPSQRGFAIFSDGRQEGIAQALDVVGSAYGEDIAATRELVGRLVGMLEETPAEAHAAAWALLSLLESAKEAWRPSIAETDLLIALVERPDLDAGAAWGLIKILGHRKVMKAVVPLISKLQDPNPEIRRVAEDALRRIVPVDSAKDLLNQLVH